MRITATTWFPPLMLAQILPDVRRCRLLCRYMFHLTGSTCPIWSVTVKVAVRLGIPERVRVLGTSNLSFLKRPDCTGGLQDNLVTLVCL